MNPNEDQKTVEPIAAPAPEAASSTPAEQPKRALLPLAIGGAIILALLIAGYWWATSYNNTPTTDYPEVVAIINGENISGAQYALNIERTNQLAQSQGAVITDPEVMALVEAQALDSLVNTTLLLQAANEAAVSIEELAVVEQYELIETQFGGAAGLQAEIDRQGMTEAELRADIAEQLLVDAYIRAETDIESLTVSEAEIATYYESLAAGGQELPPLETVAPQIEEQLLTEARQTTVQTLIDELRAAAEIEINL